MKQVSKPQIEVEIVAVTPAMAVEMLKKDSETRLMNEKRIKQYAREMKAGRWVLNGSTIAIAEDGSLIDGRHRLWAVFDADIPVTLLIVYNAVKTDTGKAAKKGKN
jgi:hypothetical protein